MMPAKASHAEVCIGDSMSQVQIKWLPEEDRGQIRISKLVISQNFNYTSQIQVDVTKRWQVTTFERQYFSWFCIAICNEKEQSEPGAWYSLASNI